MYDCTKFEYYPSLHLEGSFFADRIERALIFMIDFFVKMDLDNKFLFWLVVTVIAVIINNYAFWLVVIIQTISNIHDTNREKFFSKLFSSECKGTWTILLIQTIFIIFYYFTFHQPWMPQSELEDLSKLKGNLEYAHYSKGGHWYVENDNGDQRIVKFIMNKEARQYEGEPAIVWYRRAIGQRYVYQMTSPEGAVYISIEETNKNLFRYNINGLIFDLWILNNFLMFIYLGVARVDWES